MAGAPCFTSVPTVFSAETVRPSDALKRARAVAGDPVAERYREFTVMLLVASRPSRQGGFESQPAGLFAELPDGEDHLVSARP